MSAGAHHRNFVVADLDVSNGTRVITNTNPAVLEISGRGVLFHVLAGPFRTRSEAAAALLRMVGAADESVTDDALLVYAAHLLGEDG